MKSKNLLRCLLLVSTAISSGCASYHVQPQETSVHAVMERWAKENNKSLRWDIEDLELLDAKALNRQLEFTYNLPDAVVAFLNTAELARRRLNEQAHEPAPLPIMACIYDNAVWVAYRRGAALACSGQAMNPE